MKAADIKVGEEYAASSQVRGGEGTRHAHRVRVVESTERRVPWSNRMEKGVTVVILDLDNEPTRFYASRDIRKPWAEAVAQQAEMDAERAAKEREAATAKAERDAINLRLSEAWAAIFGGSPVYEEGYRAGRPILGAFGRDSILTDENLETLLAFALESQGIEWPTS